ncbi:hypothetical protein DFJ75_3504 [Williamsia muralis]|uniref:Uncharacterized protein n=1 Tax=Williamsia marianensis TaxID=85044 RepID=A0A495K632_WILMA|nr:hypothetical protein DFJ75_3504 [Williamsia muralis]
MSQRMHDAVFLTGALVMVGCSPNEAPEDGQGAIRSEAEARLVVTENVRAMTPYDINITPQNATMTPCGDNFDVAIGEGPPWSVGASGNSDGPHEISGAIRQVDALAESGYRLQPTGPLPTLPEQRVYKDDRGYTIGISASELSDGIAFEVFSKSPCTIDQP